MTRKKTVIIISCLIVATILVAYLVLSTTLNPTTLYVNPQTIKRAIGQDFIINISISSVSDLFGWEFKLNWTATILDVVNVTEGPFLKSGLRTTVFHYNSAIEGHVRAQGTLTGNVYGVNGSGVLATIQFHVKGSGECKLDLYEATLLDPSENSIGYTMKSGEFST
jgi:hypothetical protein